MTKYEDILDCSIGIVIFLASDNIGLGESCEFSGAFSEASENVNLIGFAPQGESCFN